MKFILSLLFIFIFNSQAKAENSTILKCKTSNKEWASTVVLDSVGSGFIKFKNLKLNQSHTCSLSIEYIKDAQKAIKPNITIEFNRGSCDPSLGKLNEEIFNKFMLIVSVYKNNKSSGHIQWLKKHQPDTCVVEKLSLFDIALNVKKWNAGIWGRSTASD
jgi:hypothetical protein